MNELSDFNTVSNEASHVALAGARLRLATERHREGIASGVDFDNAQAELTEGRVLSEAARIDVQLAGAELRCVTGQP